LHPDKTTIVDLRQGAEGLGGCQPLRGRKL
jgi:hypothetical protein